MKESEILRLAIRLTGIERRQFLSNLCGTDKELQLRLEAQLDRMESAATEVQKSRTQEKAPTPNPPGLAAGHAQSSDSSDDLTHESSDPLPGESLDGSSLRMVVGDGARERLETGMYIGPYQLLEPLGQGGMGDVWRAVQREPFRREVALKVVRSGFGTKEILARFDAERQALALMNHPNIAKILDAGKTVDGLPYFVMEVVEGTRITFYCDQHRLSIADRLRLFVEVCSAVQHAHQKGIIHRDLKPGNILVEHSSNDARGVPKVIDFGLAKAIGESARLSDHSALTSLGQILGTLKYMSPEQASLDSIDIDTRADIYALGVILYELLTGSTPLDDPSIKGQAALKVLQFIRDYDPVKPSSKLGSATHEERSSITNNRQTDNARLNRALLGDLDWIVMKALEKDRARRYESASGFASDIVRYLKNEPVTARPPSVGYRVRKFVRKNRVSVTVAALLLGSLIVGLVGTGWGMRQAIHARQAETLSKENEAAQRKIAEQKQQEAETAAQQERLAKEQSNRRLAQIQQINNAVFDIFTEFDITQVREGTNPVEYLLGNRLAEMGRELDSSTIDDPLILAALWDRLGSTLVSLGLNEQAIDFLNLARQLRSEKLGLEHSDTLSTINNLAAAFRADSKFGLAMPLYEQVLETRRRVLGMEHPDTLVSQTNLALGHGSLGAYPRAIELLEGVFNSRVKALGENHPDTLATMSKLGTAYLSAGHFKQAIALLVDALKRVREHQKENPLDTINILNSLAAAYEKNNQVAKAVPLFEEALRQHRQRLGRDHPTTLNSLNNLAYGYQANQQPQKSLPLFEELLELSKVRFGHEHPKTGLAMGRLGTAQMLSGNLPKAIPNLEKGRNLLEKHFGEIHPETIDILNSLGAAYRGANRWAESLQYFERAWEASKTTLGEDHPETINKMNNVAAACLSVGAPEKAIPLFELSLKQYREKVGPSHPRTLNAMHNLAATYVRINDLPRAIALFEELVEVQRSITGDDHPETIKRVFNLASQLRNSGDLRRAIAMFQDVLNWRKLNLGVDHPETLSLMNTLGATYWSNAQLEKSLPLLEDTLERMERTLGRENLTTQATVANLGINYRDVGRMNEGLALLEEAYEISQKVETLAWVGPQLLATYIAQEDSRKAAALGETLKEQASKSFPPGSIELANHQVAISTWLVKTTRLALAESLIGESIEIYKDKAPESLRFFEAKTILGELLLKQEKFAEAEVALIEGYEGLKASQSQLPPNRRPTLKSSVENLIRMYEKTAQPESQQKWEAELGALK